MDRDQTSPPNRPPRRRRSASPDTRDYSARGGGRSSSRQRSPNHYAGAGAGPGANGRSRDNGYGDRGRPGDGYGRGGGGGRGSGRGGGDGWRDGRDGGEEWGGGGRGGGRRRDEGYSERDRVRERQSERQRYDVDTLRERPKMEDGEDDRPSVEPEKPDFGNSGLLAKETNTVKGVQLKYNEPPEARKPLKNWRLYVFKGKEQLDLIHIYRQSAYLVGRDEVVTDIPIAHPSCSKQHAAIQYRQISEKNEYGEVTTSVKPFIIDLDSTNGTHVNDEEIPKSRYYELRNSDVIKFGTSSREYVLLHEDATT